MARKRYLVVQHRGVWKISFEGNRYGPYATRQDAIRSAVDAAQHEGRAGNAAQVVVQSDDATLRTEWTYGQDPYPTLI